MPGAPVFQVSYFALWLLVLCQSLVLLEMVRRSATQRQSETGNVEDSSIDQLLPTGALLPAFEAQDLETESRVSHSALQGSQTLMVFVTPTCTTCHQLAGELLEFGQRTNARLAVVCQGELSACAAVANTSFPGAMALHDDGSIALSFRIRRTPTAVLVDAEGRILKYGFPKSELHMELGDFDLGITPAASLVAAS